MSAALFHMIAGAPEPVGPFSHATEAEGWVFITGQMPTYPGSPEAAIPEGIEAQTELVLHNLAQVLSGLGLGLRDVLRVGVYLTHFQEDYPVFNRLYRRHFPAGRLPARTCVGVTALARGARVEIDLIARRPSLAPSAC